MDSPSFLECVFCSYWGFLTFRHLKTIVDAISISDYMRQVPRTWVVTAAENNHDVVWYVQGQLVMWNLFPSQRRDGGKGWSGRPGTQGPRRDSARTEVDGWET